MQNLIYILMPRKNIFLDCGDRIKDISFNSICGQERAWVKITEDLQQDLHYLPIPSTVAMRKLG